MPRLSYSQRSQADLAEIWDYIAEDSPRHADAVLLRLYNRIEQLRTQPLSGHRRPDLRPHIRCLTSDGYIVIYRATKTDVRIDRIVHHSRNLSRLEFPEDS